MSKPKTATSTSAKTSKPVSSKSAVTPVPAVVTPTTPSVVYLDGMPNGIDGRSLYSRGNASDAFLSCIAGTTAAKLSALASEHTKQFVFGKHLTERGRSGLLVDYMIDGKLHSGPINFGKLEPTATVRVCNVRPSGFVVNSTFSRGMGVTTAEHVSIKTHLAELRSAAKPVPVSA